ncbi:DNA repair protein SMC6 KNAG_0B06010 [Huiozyma naganishii CBS 8797]|uniref:RecF/RecN/SMC N-terminal domain-containing protein n=1 Tax=Huiozyma naganishii (strain ATCC MYA-139 / BCRC 22969 / CBS 8797 / KCTC 17520 / NBRC 10181 / NCYC 3082 / Yp74L-3) TaxID=1071383 RepID=J7S5A8_HUIN7|nr:hypothetical protein KNAG_0B06010 [Kazachstania naganishii CBS 8797]CCK69031.1 hypothetical protein KNAG_0B06010 [Kazachstania naganishii CBS 8797]
MSSVAAVEVTSARGGTDSQKRSYEGADEELLGFAARETQDSRGHARKKRRRTYNAMTQYSQTDTSIGGLPTHIVQSFPAGYIKKVVLKNFMCHEHFEMDLGPKLNFIVGNNGSGKSAILTAITVGLGAKAAETNRGNSLKDLIKEGCHRAKIAITLENESYGAYQPDVFGSEIIIERTIKRDGTATFSLRTETRNVISTKRKDVLTIVDYFSVPISNPMCFLSQDAARSFLTASTPHDKYLHFMKGTLLQEINDNLDRAKLICETSQNNMVLHYSNLKTLKHDYEDSKRLVKELNQTSNLTERKLLLQGKSLWLDIEHNEKSVSTLQEKIDEVKGKIREVDGKIEGKHQKIERFKTDAEQVTSTIEAKLEEITEIESKHQEVREKLRVVRNKFEIEKSNEKQAQESIKKCEENIRNLDVSIKRLEDELQREMGGDKEQMRQELNELEAKQEQLLSKSRDILPALETLESNDKALENERASAISEVQRIITERTAELQNISKGMDSFLSNFDPNIEMLLKTINHNKHRFRELPIGPLGNYISVKDEFKEWLRPIQRYLSSSLSSFVVTNAADNKLLRQIIKQCRLRTNIPIVTYKFSNFNFENGKPQGPHTTVLDVLSFKDPKISRLLVDLNKIEKVVLIKNKDEARNYLRSGPRNVTMALALRDENSGFQLVGGYRLDTVSYQMKLRLKAGSSGDGNASYIKELIHQEEHRLSQVRNNFEEKIKGLQTDLRKMHMKHRDVNNELKLVKQKIRGLRINLDKEVDTGVLTSKKDERENQLRAIESYKLGIKELEKTIASLADDAQPLKNLYDEGKRSLMKAKDELSEFKERASKRESKIEKLTDEIKYYEGKKLDMLETITGIEQNITSLSDGLKKQVESAKRFCTLEQSNSEELPNDQEEIKKELDRISKSIQRVENQIGFSQDKVLELYDKSRSKYKEGQNKYLAVHQALELLQESIEKRWQNFHHLRHVTCLEADLDFRSSIRVRGFAGNLVFVEDTKSLEIHIVTANDEEARDVDTLSGGEKSFSQMALLLATWKPMRSRIIALDEFDVFMDQVNRKIGTALIVKKLKNESRTQTIIITPQDIGKITEIDSTGVKIHKMKDPQRQNNSNNTDGRQ